MPKTPGGEHVHIPPKGLSQPGLVDKLLPLQEKMNVALE